MTPVTKPKGKATAKSPSLPAKQHADNTVDLCTPLRPTTVHANSSTKPSTTPRVHRISEVESNVRNQLTSANDRQKLEIFDALCGVLQKKIQHHIAALHHGKDSTQLVHVLDAAADAIKREFVAPADPSPSSHAHDSGNTVHAVVASLEAKLQSLNDCEQEWRAFEDAVPSTLTSAASPPSFSSESPFHYCSSFPVQIATDQRSLTARVTDVGTKMQFVEASLGDVDRMVDVSHAVRGSLFNAFHATEFKGYDHMHTPKEAIKSLMALLS
ncbi:hypothetical protein, variant [Aphanomyces astaci]|nr:hypothetical protein, variant [Aphanomyces astaci]ETV70539.1 hypothetical protein, variant [Aphanomyces astaci]|eukprot:XP_009839922.1 hypothetical protein, variant [Aphanomyces astaci]